MYLINLENKLTKEPDFIFYDSSFHIEDLKNTDDLNTRATITNLLSSSNPCMITWTLYNLDDLFGITYENELIDLLDNEDLYVNLKSCEILTRIYSNRIPSEKYLQYIKQILNSNAYEMIEQVLTFLSELLYNKKDSLKIVNNELFDRNIVKIKFCEDYFFIKMLKKFIKIGELQYKIIKIIAILSFNQKCTTILEEHGIFSDVLHVLNEKTREKVMRLCTLTLRNTLKHKVRYSLLNLNVVMNICNGTYIDEEMTQDMIYMKNKIGAILKKTKLIDIYFEELFGGKLEKSPFHYTDTFWETNMTVLSENKVEIVKALKKYIKSTNNTLVCIACNDLYRLNKVLPETYTSIQKYGIKDDLFVLTHSDNEDVRFNAIQALSGCILGEWTVKDKKNE
ncbi:V-type proton ATPase subunit H [Binucleata daphniae]